METTGNHSRKRAAAYATLALEEGACLEQLLDAGLAKVVAAGGGDGQLGHTVAELAVELFQGALMVGQLHKGTRSQHCMHVSWLHIRHDTCDYRGGLSSCARCEGGRR